jgi:hypothetical protein
MKEIRLKLHTALLSLVVASTTAAMPLREAAVAKGGRSFTIYDTLFYRGKPNTVQEGLIVSDILYEDRIWPRGENSSVLPERSSFENARIIRIQMYPTGLSARFGLTCRTGCSVPSFNGRDCFPYPRMLPTPAMLSTRRLGAH